MPSSKESRVARPLDDAILRQLTACPFLDAFSLEERWGLPSATVARALARLRAAGLVERVPLGEGKTLLYVPTGDGILVAAARDGADPANLCRVYGLDRRQLLARLPLLKRLAPAQPFVMDLARALDEGGRGRLGFYKGGPPHWRAARGTRGDRGGARGEVLLDGMGRIDLARADGSIGRSRGVALSHWFGLLWDGDGSALDIALRYRLDRLGALGGDGAPARPPVLVVTAAAGRIVSPGAPPPSGVIYTTVHDYIEHGPLRAHWVVRRRGGGVVEDTLLALLATVPATRHNPWGLTVWPQGRVRAGDALELERWVAGLRAGHIEPTPTPTGLLALALPRGVVALLDVIGSYPLLDAKGLTLLTRRNASVLRDELGWLRELGLVRVYKRGVAIGGRLRFADPKDEGTRGAVAFAPGERPVLTYALTYRGTHLLAGQLERAAVVSIPLVWHNWPRLSS